MSAEDEHLPIRLDERLRALEKLIEMDRSENKAAHDALMHTFRDFVRLSRFRPVEALAYAAASLMASAAIAAVATRWFGH